MAQRKEPKDSRDDFPTPPWATSGLLESRGEHGAGERCAVRTEYGLSAQALSPALRGEMPVRYPRERRCSAIRYS
jgi:hypothetical protein